MKKDTMRLLIVTVAALIAYNLAVFLIPCYKTTTFWISWGFSLLSFAVSGYAIYTGLIRRPDAKSRFYGFPIARIGVLYLVGQIIAGSVCMAIGHIIPWWLATVAFAIGFAAALIGVVAAEAVVDQIQYQDNNIRQSVAVMRGLQSRLSPILAQCSDATAAEALRAFAEELRYSDPVSCDAIAQTETALSDAVDALQAGVTEGNTDQILTACRQASALLAERNRLCKLNKQ